MPAACNLRKTMANVWHEAVSHNCCSRTPNATRYLQLLHSSQTPADWVSSLGYTEFFLEPISSEYFPVQKRPCKESPRIPRVTRLFSWAFLFLTHSLCSAGSRLYLAGPLSNCISSPQYPPLKKTKKTIMSSIQEGVPPKGDQVLIHTCSEFRASQYFCCRIKRETECWTDPILGHKAEPRVSPCAQSWESERWMTGGGGQGSSKQEGSCY